MPAAIQVHVKGLKELIATFGNSVKIINPALDRAIKSIIVTIQGASIPHTPVDTGFLRSRDKLTFGELIGRLEKVAPYAIFVHDGTKFMTARPFLDQGIKSASSNIERILSGTLKGIVAKLAK